DAVAQCPQKLFVGPAADSGFRIGGDVRAVEGPERRSERSPAGIGLPAMPAISVTVLAAGGVREIGRSRHRVRCRREAQNRQQRDRRCPQYSVENTSWTDRRSNPMQGRGERLLFLDLFAERRVAPAAAVLAEIGEGGFDRGLIAAVHRNEERVGLGGSGF